MNVQKMNRGIHAEITVIDEKTLQIGDLIVDVASAQHETENVLLNVSLVADGVLGLGLGTWLVATIAIKKAAFELIEIEDEQILVKKDFNMSADVEVQLFALPQGGTENAIYS